MRLLSITRHLNLHAHGVCQSCYQKAGSALSLSAQCFISYVSWRTLLLESKITRFLEEMHVICNFACQSLDHPLLIYDIFVAILFKVYKQFEALSDLI